MNDDPKSETARAIPADMNPAIVAEIDHRLARLMADKKVRIGLAVESGSRGWGFPSADSDYDCRFVYIRPRRDYMALFPKRDVIELPIEGDLDINGWDVAKAIRLLHKGNAVIVEWLTSPIVYCAIPGFREGFLELARRIGGRDQFAQHYYHRGRNHLAAMRATDPPGIKHALYALRSAMALRWLWHNPADSIVPMHLPTMCAGADLTPDMRHRIDDLIAAKADLREGDTLLLPPEIVNLIDQELARFTPPAPSAMQPNQTEQAETYFRTILDTCAPSE